VPDLQWFPVRDPGAQRVRFDAGLELAVAQSAFWLLAAPVRIGLIDNASRAARFMHRWGRHWDWMGGDTGGMHIGLCGADRKGRVARIDWYLAAGHGPQSPCLPAIVIARKPAAGKLAARGAMPCMGLMSLAEFGEAVNGAQPDISWRACCAGPTATPHYAVTLVKPGRSPFRPGGPAAVESSPALFLSRARFSAAARSQARKK
jgi:hypothetical protein